MSSRARVGRPRASSRATLADAACELFLERGYEQTAVADIARRAGVSRSSFFNYFASKSDILWSGFDERMAAATVALGQGVPVTVALQAFADGFVPDTLALAIVHADAMGLALELERDRAVRQLRIAATISARRRAEGIPALTADINGAGFAAAIMGALWQWAQDGAGATPLSELVPDALALVPAP